MSVTNAKHVRVVALLEVGVEDEAVLVLFVRVSGHVADPRCESILGNDVFQRRWNLFFGGLFCRAATSCDLDVHWGLLFLLQNFDELLLLARVK
jgi:hypothetical protein